MVTETRLTLLKRRIRRAFFFPAIWLRLWKNYAYDRRRFQSWSSVVGLIDEQAQLRAWINADYHKIEKALSLRSPRPGFGSAVVARLLDNMEIYQARFGSDVVCGIAINVLRAYCGFNRSVGIDVRRFQLRIEDLASLETCASLQEAGGGTMEMEREALLRRSRIDLSDFFASRFSVRQFEPRPVPRVLLEKAVRMAQKTPSVCNRQSVKVYAFDEPGLREEVLACQKGNAGFGQELQVVFVVTSDTRTFFSVGERNQCWIDGGLFSMSLVYALHSLGLGTICLNWSAELDADRELKRIADIPDWDAIIMLIGVGFLPKRFSVAQSPRKALEEVLVWADRPGD